MLKKLRNRIEKKRNSKSFFWKTAVSCKDFLWFYLFHYYRNILFWLKSHYKNRPIWLNKIIPPCRNKFLYLIDLFFYKKPQNGQIKVKIIHGSSFCEFIPIRTYERFCKNYRTWNNLILTDKVFADYYVIINNPHDNLFQYYRPEKTIVFQNEPKAVREKWGIWSSPKKNNFLCVYDTANYHNLVVWWIDKSYDWLTDNPIRKTKQMSTIISNFYWLPGHKKRFDFLWNLDKNFEIDVFGRENSAQGIYSINSRPLSELKSYKGELPALFCKDEGLLPYKYFFAAENSSEENYFTEKIVDAIVSECLCFYWGCPNIEKFIDPRAFIRIDLDKPLETIETIKSAIQNNEWEKRLPFIKEAKWRILNELQIMPTIEKILSGSEEYDAETKNRDTRKL